MQAFSEAAEGIRTLDLLHGKQTARGGQFGCKRAVLTGETNSSISAHFRSRPQRVGLRSGLGGALDRFLDGLAPAELPKPPWSIPVG
jgi:hypothetical protein